MCNTYGLHSINRKTFNIMHRDSLYYPKEVRDIIVTALRLHNGVLNVLGYIPGVSFFSGCARILTGTVILLVTLAIGERNAHTGMIIGRFYDEALLTGVSQLARGILEAFVPFGWVANATLDVIATYFNLTTAVEGSLNCEGCMGGGRSDHRPPHDDVSYPALLKFLRLF